MPDAVEVLEERLRRYSAERYPIQHATTQFHLGIALTGVGRLADAAGALERAAYLFEDRLVVEHAKSLNALGAVYRLQQRHQAAADVFRQAATEFGAKGKSSEHAAALYNLGLVEREIGEPALAAASFRQAISLFGESERHARAAACRELGVTLLEVGDLEQAVVTLAEARDRSQHIGDQVGLGAAANALGLALLASGDSVAAADAFRQSSAANPRALRPADYAMAKANLALALLESHDTARARLAAGQALAVAAASDVVRSQAAGVLQRAGEGPGAIHEVLRDESLEAWPGLLREEFARWADLDAAELGDELRAWINFQIEDAREADLAEAWVGALLELPPEHAGAIARRLLEVLAEQPAESREMFHAQLRTAMARFHVPQWERLQALFNQLAEELGQEPSW